ncbi:MAG: hypothetical protein KKA36_05560, partial [Gammaproteobacteria bacterium]|nr:hypothetical protein [Gammaproteobacteria bacterium]
WKGFKRLRAREGKQTTVISIVAFLLALIWLGASFWYSGGRKIYYDRQVENLCAIDGGIKVYETVRLPADKFNQWGQINFFRPNKGDEALGPDYIYKSESRYLINGENGRVAILRHHDSVYRRLDKRLLGEQIGYARRGGDFPGPWHPSSFSCPNFGSESILNKIFVKLQ